MVAKAYTQTYGVDYLETYSSVAKIDMIRVLFSVSSNKGWSPHQFDVKNVFIHGELRDNVYMKAQLDFSDEFRDNEICWLTKALYSLKQSPQTWFRRFTMAMEQNGCKEKLRGQPGFIFSTLRVMKISGPEVAGSKRVQPK